MMYWTVDLVVVLPVVVVVVDSYSKDLRVLTPTRSIVPVSRPIDGSLVVERQTVNRWSQGRIPFATVSKLGHVNSLHNAPVHSAV